MGLAHSPKIATDGLVLCLDAGNTKSYPGTGTTWSDLSGNGNDGSLVNMDGANLDSVNGGSLTFDGSNEHIIVQKNSNFIFSQDFSYGCWFNLNSLVDPPYGQSLFGDWGINGNYSASNIDIRKSGINIALIANNASNTPTYITTTFDYEVNKWDNLYITKQSNTYTFYKNGQFLDSITDSNPVYDGTATQFYIGKEGNSNSWFNGKISNLSFYNKALSAEEVQQNFNALRGRFGI